MKSLNLSRNHRRVLTASIATLTAVIASPQSANAQAISINAPFTYSQNFDGLGTANVAWADGNAGVPTLVGWYAGINSNTTADGTLQVTDGATKTLTALLNLGATGAADRALGSKATGTGNFANIAFGVGFQNNSGQALRVTGISYAGELWLPNQNANQAEQWFPTYKVAAAAITDVEPGASSATAANGTFTGLAALNWVSPVAAAANANAVNGNIAPNHTALSVSNAGIIINPGQFFMFRWQDTNNAGGDGYQGIDDFSITFATLARNLVWNRTHTVGGGGPNGTWDTSANQYWLDAGNPTAFIANDDVTFSQDGGAIIDVPANISSGAITVSHASGNYSIGGVGTVAGSIVKNGAGTLTLTSANAFGSTSLDGGGLIVAQNLSALGIGGLTVNGTGGTIQADVDVTTGGSIAGAGPFTKTGPGALRFTGAGGGGTGSINVTSGLLGAGDGAALGAAGRVVTLAGGTTLEVGGNSAYGGAITVAGGAVTIANPNPVQGSAFAIGTADSITSANDIIKTGPGVVRISANQTTMTGNWIINEGTLETTAAAGVTTAFGTGTVTVNPTGIIVVQGSAAPSLTINNPITLAGGAMATRSGNNAIYAGPVNVTANSLAFLKSNSTPANVQSFTISGVVSGAGSITISGATAVAGVVPAGGALILTNVGNNNTGGFNVTAAQSVTAQSAGGTGNTLGTGAVSLESGTLRVRDNATIDGDVVNYGQDVNLATAPAPNDTFSTIDVDRQATGTFANVSVLFDELNINNGTLRTIGANGYSVVFTGPASGTGTATLQVDSASLTLAGGLAAGAYNVTKTGTGILNVIGGGALSGNIAVNGGVLVTTSNFPSAPLISVGTAGILDGTSIAGGLIIGGTQTLSGSGIVAALTSIADEGTVAAPSGAFTIGTLSLGQAAGDDSKINITLDGTPGSIVISDANGLSTVGGVGKAKFYITSASLAAGSYILLNYDGAIGGSGFAGFAIGSLPQRTIASLVDDGPNTQVLLSVTGVDFPKWTGAVSNEWSTNAIAGNKNWKENGSGNNTDFLANDKVLLDDTATTTTPDISNGDVAVNQLDFNNTTKDYTLTGANGIANGAAGPVALNKTGGGKLTINNANSFTGPVNINGGTVSVATLADGGVNSPLGAGTVISLDIGTLEYTGAAAGSTNRAVNVGGAGGNINSANGVNLNGAVALTGVLTLDSGAATSTISSVISGGGALVKNGAGTLVLTGVGSTYAGGTTVSAGTLQIGDGVVATVGAGVPGTGPITNDAALVVNNAGAVTLSNDIGGSGTLTKTGAGQLILAGAVLNTYTGLTTVTTGEVVLSKTAGINAIGGDLVVDAGGIVSYGTTAGQLDNHIADTATITINGGTFGSGSANTQANPTTGITDTVANVVLNSGTFLSGRTTSLTPFTASGTFDAISGTVLAQRGGSILGGTVNISGAIVNLDGGSTTGGEQSKLRTGAGGLHLTSATINFNTGPSNLTATSVGSIVGLGGDVTSTGATTFNNVTPAAATAAVSQLDLGAATRTINVAGTLNLGTAAAPVVVTNGGILKTGTGTLALSGNNTYAGITHIAEGTLAVAGGLSATSEIEVDAGATLDVTQATGGALTLGATQTLKGSGSILGNIATSAGTKIIPGSSPGTLTIGGDFDISAAVASAASAALLFELGAPTSDLVTLPSGVLNIGATNLEYDDFDFTAITGFVAGTYTLVDTAQPITGSLGADLAGIIIGPDLTAYDAVIQLGSGGQDVQLVVTVVPEPGSAALLLGGLGLLAGARRRRR